MDKQREGSGQKTLRKEVLGEVDYEVSLSDVVIAEYMALRGEIDVYHEHQRELVNYTLVLLGVGLGSLLPLLSSPGAQKVAFVVLLISPLVSLLGLIHTDRTIRILRIAYYIHNYLRKEAVSLTKQKVWQWEIYKRYASPFRKEITLILDRVRWLVFTLPCLISIAIFLSTKAPAQWSLLERVLFWIAVISPLITLATTFLVEETTGVGKSSIKDLDEYDDAL